MRNILKPRRYIKSTKIDQNRQWRRHSVYFFTLLLCYLLISSGKQDKFTAKLSVLVVCVTAARQAKRVEILYPAKRFQNNFFIYIFMRKLYRKSVY